MEKIIKKLKELKVDLSNYQNSEHKYNINWEKGFNEGIEKAIKVVNYDEYKKNTIHKI